MSKNVQSVQLIKTWLCAVFGRRGRLSLAALICLLVAPALAHAHGAMSSDELGPPLFTSGLLGFVSYWVVMLWPSSRKKDDPQAGADRQQGNASQPKRRNPQSAARVKRRPHLRVVEPGDQFPSDQQARRKASDG